MKICDQYNHNDALEIINKKDSLLQEISEILTTNELTFGHSSTKEIKLRINERFNKKGWADKVRLGTSNLTISFLKSKIGICFQIGNVARTYADVLKLGQLKKKGIIDAGIIIVPHKLESKMMGANYASYDRLAKELSHFNEIIQVPILVIGLSN